MKKDPYFTLNILVWITIIGLISGFGYSVYTVISRENKCDKLNGYFYRNVCFKKDSIIEL